MDYYVAEEDKVTDFIWYFLFYSFMGWIMEVGFCAVLRKQFRNRGFLSAPLIPLYGIAFSVLIVVLPHLNGHYAVQFFVVVVVASVAEQTADEFTAQVGKSVKWESGHDGLLSGNKIGAVTGVLIAAVYYITYLVVHPLLIGVTLLIPVTVKNLIAAIACFAMAMDFSAVFYAVRTGKTEKYEARQKNGAWNRVIRWISDSVRKRLQKAYPGFWEMSSAEQDRCRFAQGFCLDKLIWVFFLSSFLGDLIEMLYCRVTAGVWMSRSSVLYGPFSFVWGAGAALLTVALQHLAKKNDRYVFAAGFVVGGVYEYSCSVITEALFGTVFWDYSDMPLNIGGRTNVLFCFFWGTLAVIWVKEIYPCLSGLIESLPHLIGKLLTWLFLVFMVCNAVLTMAAMLRYGTRDAALNPSNPFEAFLDEQYPDKFMEKRWKNMKTVEDRDLPM